MLEQRVVVPRMNSEKPLSERDEVAELRAALEFYAQSANWQREIVDVGVRINWVMPQAHRDKGARARMALARFVK